MRILDCKTPEDRKVVVDGINSYNDSQTSRILEPVQQKIELVAKNDTDEIVGGVFGYVNYYAGFKINTLWAREDARETGLGSKLLLEAEKRAKKMGATVAILDTFSFQAEKFYLKKGYEVFGRITDFPKENQEFIFLKKRL